MWVLKCQENDRLYYIKSTRKNYVGRTAGDLVFIGDKSISRKHAIIFNDSDKITIEDLGSCYGTYLNGNLEKRFEPNTRIEIKKDDVVRFGTLQNNWVLCKLDIVTCMSAKIKQTTVIRKQLAELGVRLCNEWDSTCTILTAPLLTISSVKVLLSLIHMRPIVKPEYWTACLNSFNNNIEMPSQNHYRPELNEPSLNHQSLNFDPDETRSHLFLNKRFVFFSQTQMAYYSPVIVEAKGECLLLKEHKLTKSQLCSPNLIVIHYPTGNLKGTQMSQIDQSKFEAFEKYMIEKKYRIVPESEIGLAIIYSSTVKYCNPTFTFSLILNTSNSESRYVQVLAQETQDVSLLSRKINNVISCSTEELSTNENNMTQDTRPSTSMKSKNFRSISPNADEPLKKKRNYISCLDTPTTSNSKSSPCPQNDDLFSFIEEPVITKKPTTVKKFVPCTLKPRNVRNFEIEDANLFNFLPDDTVHNAPRFESRMLKNRDEVSIASVKRKHDGSDTPDGKRIPSSSNFGAMQTSDRLSCRKMIKTDLTSSPWLGCQGDGHTVVFVKKEVGPGVSESSSKNEVDIDELNLLCSSVTINESLIKMKNASLPRQQSSGKNSKKFSKVVPLKKHGNNTISRSCLIPVSDETIQSVNPVDNCWSSDEDVDKIIHKKTPKVQGRGIF